MLWRRVFAKRLRIRGEKAEGIAGSLWKMTSEKEEEQKMSDNDKVKYEDLEADLAKLDADYAKFKADLAKFKADTEEVKPREI